MAQMNKSVRRKVQKVIDGDTFKVSHRVSGSQYIRELVRSNTAMEHGDSGGTVVNSSDKGNLYGIVSTHDWWGYYHVPYDQITSEMGITAVLN